MEGLKSTTTIREFDVISELHRHLQNVIVKIETLKVIICRADDSDP